MPRTRLKRKKRRAHRSYKEARLSYSEKEYIDMVRRASMNATLAHMPKNKRGVAYRSLARAEYFLTVTGRVP